MDIGLKEIEKISDIQELLYDLMREFHSICEKHNLYYVVFGGTMLGAVRHKGIIPWDDDIDVCMPRDDYNKFCKIVGLDYHKKFCIKSYPQDCCVWNYAKFCRTDTLLVEDELLPKLSKHMLFIDVFPVDGYPTHNKEKKHFKKLNRYKSARWKAVCRISSTKLWYKFLYEHFMHFPYRLIGYKYFIKKYIKESTKYNFENCDYVSMQGAGWNEKGKLSKDVFLNRKLYKFGDFEVWGISDYDGHLTKLYGDYMTPPPKEKQVSNHSYKLYIKEEKTL